MHAAFWLAYSHRWRRKSTNLHGENIVGYHRASNREPSKALVEYLRYLQSGASYHCSDFRLCLLWSKHEYHCISHTQPDGSRVLRPLPHLLVNGACIFPAWFSPSVTTPCQNGCLRQRLLYDHALVLYPHGSRAYVAYANMVYTAATDKADIQVQQGVLVHDLAFCVLVEKLIRPL